MFHEQQISAEVVKCENRKQLYLTHWSI